MIHVQGRSLLIAAAVVIAPRPLSDVIPVQRKGEHRRLDGQAAEDVDRQLRRQFVFVDQPVEQVAGHHGHRLLGDHHAQPHGRDRRTPP